MTPVLPVLQIDSSSKIDPSLIHVEVIHDNFVTCGKIYCLIKTFLLLCVFLLSHLMLRETEKPTYQFLNILGNSTRIGAVKRKSSENNGSLVSKQAKSCSEVTVIYFCHFV